MHKINDYLVYKRDVCKVVDIKENYYKDLTYYILKPILDETLKIEIPVTNPLIRDVITKEDLDKIIENIPNVRIIETDNKLIENEYKRLLNSDKYEDLISIIKTSYQRNKEREEEKKKISEKDKFYFDKAEKLLYSEFSVVLNMSYEDTKKYVVDKVISLV